ncbi:hypothetical protein FKP32DRAFT_1562016, partial [Trametes sanguinea]
TTPQTFLLNTLDHLLRIPVSDSLMRMFIYVLRECGVRVPTFEAFRKLQANLRQNCGVPTIPCKSARGNIFWMVDPRALLAKDWSNLSIRSEIHVYPEIPDGPISEVWHSEKWHSGMDLSMLSPMYDAGTRHYYVNEVARLDSGQLVLPVRWVIFRGKLHADVHRIVCDQSGLAIMDTTQTEMVAGTSLAANYFDLEAEGTLPQWAGTRLTHDAETPPSMPNPLREIAQGEPLYTSFVNHFVDDVSGNRSKSWNKHINTYITHANLPRKLLQQEGHIHFVSTSPNATAAEQFCDFKRIIQSTHDNPVRVIDPETQCAVRFRIFNHAEPLDNPMQSELSGHIGGNGNYLCRKCHAGGTTVQKSSNEGFHSLFTPGEHRNKDEVLESLKEQVRMACLGVEKHVRTLQTETGVKDPYTEYAISELIRRVREEKQRNPGRSSQEIQAELLSWVDANTEAVYNPFLTMPGLDPTHDTPVEVLHTVLLGVVKYAWHWTHTSWTPAQKTVYAQRLQATSITGLSVHAIRASYIIQYANSLIGRQLKTLAQTTAFHVHDMLPQPRFKLWLAIGEMTSLIRFPEIHDKETYKNDLTIAIANVLDLFAEKDPTKIVEKVKLHILSHGIEDVSRFGPLIGMCTEGFKSFNGIFRNASIYSNHLALSRDIAQQLADHEAHKHRLLGRFFMTTDGDWVQAGTRIRDFLRHHPLLRRLFGWTVDVPSQPGTFKLAAAIKGQSSRPTTDLGSTQARNTLNIKEYDLRTTWTLCRDVITCAQDVCVRGSWICARSPIAVIPFLQDSTYTLGRIEELLADPVANKAIAVIDVFQVASTRHAIFNMPWLARRQDEPSFMIVDVAAIQFTFNAQHDCTAAGCTARSERPVRQERSNSSVMEKFIEHDLQVQKFVVNMHSLHNPHLIRRVLPRSLVAPVPHFSDRRQAHDKLAQVLRDGYAKKHAAAAARKAAKKTKENPPVAAHELETGTGLGEEPDDTLQVATSVDNAKRLIERGSPDSTPSGAGTSGLARKRRRVAVDETVLQPAG